MKYLIVIIAVFAIGCASIEHKAYITAGISTTAVELSRQAYNNYANTCLCVTSNEYERVEKIYVRYQSAVAMLNQAIGSYQSSAVPNTGLIDASVLAISQSAADLTSTVLRNLPTDNATLLGSQLKKVK